MKNRNIFGNIISRKKSIGLYLTAFMLPALIMLEAFRRLEIYPFGDRQAIIVDGWHQYYPFFAELHRKLREGESLLYCWRIGMGIDFISLISYYLASPLNLLIVLFPVSRLQEVFTLFILIKIGFSGLFCAFSLNEINRTKEPGVVIFSTFYALCGWAVGYYFNTIWLDTFAIFPLVVSGINKVVKKNEFRLYIISLASAIIANYYIGLMVCFFTVFYFFVQCIVNKNSVKELFVNLKNIVIYSTVSVMISAVATLPSFVALQDACKTNAKPEKWQIIRGWLEIFVDSLAFNTDITYLGNFPYIYCGIASMIFLFAFFKMKKTGKREKAAYAVFIIFFYAGINVNVLNYLWHGMHNPNAFPDRFTFMFSFLLIMLAYQAFSRAEEISKTDCLMICLFAGMFYLLVSFETIREYAKNNNFESVLDAVLSGELDFKPFLFRNMLIIAEYLLIICLFEKKMFNKKVFTLFIAVIAGLELVPTVISKVEVLGTTERNNYPDKYGEVQEILSKIDAEAENDFFRVELAKLFTLNPSAIYGYNGISEFSSVVKEAKINLLKDMGFRAEYPIRYSYQNSTPVNNMFLNLKYLISRGEQMVNQEYLTEKWRVNDVYAYENTAYLPIGFMVEQGMANYKFEGDTPFEKQNNLVKAATGIEEDVFEALDIIHVGHENVCVERWGYGTYTYRPPENADGGDREKFKYNYEMPQNGCAYVYMDLYGAGNAWVECGEKVEFHEIGEANIFPAGTYRKGDIFSVRSEVDSGWSGELKIFVSILNCDVLDKAYEILEEGALNVTNYTSNGLQGVIKAKKDGLMYTSVPYERGWKAYVDGERADITLIADALIGIEVKEGEHEIELKYSPAHVYAAMLLSLLGVCSLILLIWHERKRGRR